MSWSQPRGSRPGCRSAPTTRSGKQVLLQAGQSAQFGAETRFHVIVGNAGGVTLWFDGAPVALLGRSGEVVRDLVLPPPAGRSLSTGAASVPPKQ